MRFVALVAAGMARIDALALLLVTRVAPHLELLGVMRQALVAAGTRRMPFVGGDLLHVLPMAVGARGQLRGLEVEMMRLVATGAGDARVLAVFRTRVLVTRGASPRLVVGHPRFRPRLLLRMGIVAADAACAAPGMIGVNVLVATGAGGFRSCLHVVGLVTALAVGVGGNVSSAEHSQILMAGAARDRCLFSELMRTMTTDAVRVPVRKGRAGRDQGLFLRVTQSAGRHGIFGGRVLVFVAGLARLLGALPTRGMVGVDVLVAAGAGRGARRRILMRPMAAEAGLGSVRLDRRHVALLHGVAALAVAFLVGRNLGWQRSHPRVRVRGCWRRVGQQLCCIVPGAFQGEGVARRTVGGRIRPEAALCRAARVFDVSLLRVARRAALGGHRPHLPAGHRMTLRARDFFFQHVCVMAAHGARHTPALLNVDPSAPLAFGGRVTIGARGRDGEAQGGDQHPDRDRLPALHCAAF